MFRILSTLTLLLCFGGTAFTQQQSSKPPVKAPVVKDKLPAKKVDAPAPGPNVVPGISLPANFEVQYDEGFITLEATSAGPVEWIVLTTASKIKYKKASDKEVDVSVPPEECVITVFGYSVVDGKPTRAARCDISVKGPQAPIPPPNKKNPPPNVTPVKGPLTVTIVEDPTKRNPEYTLITQWVAAKDQLIKAGHKPFLISINNPNTKKWLNDAASKDKEFADALRQTTVPMVVVQDAANRPIGLIPAPKTVAELLAILGKEGE